MTDGFRAPVPGELPPARFLSSATIGSWLGILRRLPTLSGAMKMWLLDAKGQLLWREINEPRVVATRVKRRDGKPLSFTVDDSLADVVRSPTPEFEAWDHLLRTGQVTDDE